METQLSSLGPINKLSTITTITRNLSGSPSRRVFESLKSITDIRKTDLKEDLSKKYFAVLSNDNRNDSLKDLMTNEFKSIQPKQLCAGVKTSVVPKDSLNNVYKMNKDQKDQKDQSVQTDVTEFAKIKLSSDLWEKASNYIEFAEEFIEELELKRLQNSMDLTSIPTYTNRRTDLNSNNNQFNGFKSFGNSLSSNDKLNDQIRNTSDTLDLINTSKKTQNFNEMKPNTSRLILEPNVMVYSCPHNCQDYEFGEEAVETQSILNSLVIYPKTSSSEEKVLKTCVKSQSKSIKWSDLVQLIKFNQFTHFQNLNKYF